MLPKSHNQACQEFLTALLRLREHLSASSLDAGSLQEKLRQLQQFFQERIISLPDDGLEGSAASRWQSIQTEMHRTLRLLGTDILFLRSSRQATTTEQRLGTIGDRLSQLIGYCQAIVSPDND